MQRALRVAILGAAAFAACDSDGLGPQSGSLLLETAITRTVVSRDNPASIVFRVRNIGPDTIRLTFADCRILYPYVTTSNGTVIPDGGQWGCSQIAIPVMQTITLPPGGVDTSSLLVHACPYAVQGAGGLLPARSLPSGEYRTYARLEHATYQMRSRTIAFRVVCT